MNNAVPNRYDSGFIVNNPVLWITQKGYDMLKSLLVIRDTRFFHRLLKPSVGKPPLVRHDTGGFTLVLDR
jgi:hypothetical protein